MGRKPRGEQGFHSEAARANAGSTAPAKVNARPCGRGRARREGLRCIGRPEEGDGRRGPICPRPRVVGTARGPGAGAEHALNLSSESGAARAHLWSSKTSSDLIATSRRRQPQRASQAKLTLLRTVRHFCECSEPVTCCVRGVREWQEADKGAGPLSARWLSERRAVKSRAPFQRRRFRAVCPV